MMRWCRWAEFARVPGTTPPRIGARVMATSDLELSKHIAIARAVRDDMSTSDFTALASDLFPPAPSTTTAASSAN